MSQCTPTHHNNKGKKRMHPVLQGNEGVINITQIWSPQNIPYKQELAFSSAQPL
jgi:hypothetical protein